MSGMPDDQGVEPAARGDRSRGARAGRSSRRCEGDRERPARYHRAGAERRRRATWARSSAGRADGGGAAHVARVTARGTAKSGRSSISGRTLTCSGTRWGARGTDRAALTGFEARFVVNPETDFVEERFRPGERLWTRIGGREAALTIASARVQNGRPVIAFAGLSRLEDVEPLAGLELRVPEDTLQPSSPVLLRASARRVHGRDGRGACSWASGGGRSRRQSAGGGQTGEELLIPLAVEICVEIDVAARSDSDRAARGTAGSERARVAGRGGCTSGRGAGWSAARHEVRHRDDLSADGRGRPRGGGDRPGNRAGALDIQVHDLRDYHDRSSPQRGRCALRRRAGDGDEAGAAGAGRRGHPGAARGSPTRWSCCRRRAEVHAGRGGADERAAASRAALRPIRGDGRTRPRRWWPPRSSRLAITC